LIAFLKRMWACRSAADDRVVIDQASHYDAMEANCRRLRALDRAVEKEQEGIAVAVGSWARDTVSKRTRAVIPRIIVREVAAWLPGLSAQEIMNLAIASALNVKHHIFGSERIPGVRKVQPLPEVVLIWPKPRLLASTQSDRGSGGGPGAGEITGEEMRDLVVKHASRPTV
jgi:hypothetical protein